jgi:TolB protein
VAQDDGNFVIYIYWSPAPCPGQPDCRHLAYLIEETDGIGLHLVGLDEERVQDRLVVTGRPLYFTWSPDGQQILWRAGRLGRENPAAEIGLYDLQERRRDRLPVTPGAFLAPAWSPTGEHWLAVSVADGVDRLQLWDGNEPVELATYASGETAFAWAPDGQKVAYAVRNAPDASFYGPVRLFDMATGHHRQLTADTFDIMAFFWAPDGERIGYLTRLHLRNTVWMQWRVYDLGAQRDRGFAVFRPSPLMEFAVGSFNQYAQSHRFWSPDGRHLVYAERDRNLRDRVWLVDTEAEKGSDPIPVREGSFGVWSWGPPGHPLAADGDD